MCSVSRLGLNNHVYRIDFPVILTFVAFICMLANGVLFGTHRKLVNSQSLLSISPYFRLLIPEIPDTQNSHRQPSTLPPIHPKPYPIKIRHISPHRPSITPHPNALEPIFARAYPYSSVRLLGPESCFAVSPSTAQSFLLPSPSSID